MANVNNLNLAKFTAASAGTGSFVVSAAATGYQTPLTAGASNFSYRYRAEIADLTQWEIGTGTYTSSSTTLSRTPLINSVGGTSAINFTTPPTVGMGIILAEDFQGSGQILATATNDSATTGNIGEYVSSVLPSSSAIALTASTTQGLTSISLGAGDWDVHANLCFTAASTATSIDILRGCVATSSATLNTEPPNSMAYRYASGTGSIGNVTQFLTTTVRLNSSVAFTAWLNSNCLFSVAALSGYGSIWARRPR